jgi:hypothetical protein
MLENLSSTGSYGRTTVLAVVGLVVVLAYYFLVARTFAKEQRRPRRTPPVVLLPRDDRRIPFRCAVGTILSLLIVGLSWTASAGEDWLDKVDAFFLAAIVVTAFAVLGLGLVCVGSLWAGCLREVRDLDLRSYMSWGGLASQLKWTSKAFIWLVLLVVGLAVWFAAAKNLEKLGIDLQGAGNLGNWSWLTWHLVMSPIRYAGSALIALLIGTIWVSRSLFFLLLRALLLILFALVLLASAGWLYHWVVTQNPFGPVLVLTAEKGPLRTTSVAHLR